MVSLSGRKKLHEVKEMNAHDLGDSEIKRMMAEGYFPAYPKLLINPASMNVRIGASFLVPRRKWFGSVALGDEVKYKKIVCKR